MKKLLLLIFLLFLLCRAGSAQISHSLWATATAGGALGNGTIVQGDSDGSNFHCVHSFDFTNGAYPIGKMAIAGNGWIYIITELGGTGGSCTICKLNSVTDSFTKIHDFMDTPTLGAVPAAGCILATNGQIYGTTESGGANGFGVIFAIDPSNDNYTDVHDFDSTGTASNSELLQAGDGNLYGVTQPYTGVDSSTGLAYDTSGFLFSFNPTYSTFTRLYSFPSGFGLIYDATLIQASDGKIYGLVSNENADSALLFNYDINTATCNTLFVMNTNTYGYPEGGLVQGDAHTLYGTTAYLQGSAQIYGYDITANSFSTLLYLDSTTGFQPTRNMGKLSNGQLVFSTMDGGVNYQGALISFDITNRTYNLMFSFDSATTGDAPSCDILEAGIPATGTGIVNPPATVFGLYPNPANDIIYLSDAPANTAYSITNVLGQQIAKGITTDITQAIDISLLPGGVYFINDVKFVKQ